MKVLELFLLKDLIFQGYLIYHLIMRRAHNTLIDTQYKSGAFVQVTSLIID